MRTLRLAPFVFGFLLVASSAEAETVELDIFRYCQPGTFCGHPSLEAYDHFVCQAVEEMNVVFEPTGISFRPVIHPVDGTSPVDSTGLPPTKTKYYQTSGCGSGDANDAIRQHWRENVAMADTSRLSLMLTKGTNRCCSGIPRTWKDLDISHGIYCDAHPNRTLRGVGTLWAHEMGHHWSLAHTHGRHCLDAADGENPNSDVDAWIQTGCDLEHVSCDSDADCVDGGSCVPDGLPLIEDTPADRCRFETCKPKCQNDPDKKSCETNADCDSGEGPCACPGADEDMQGNLLDEHTWFASPGEVRPIVPSVDGLSYGSPHMSWCPAQIKTQTGGVTLPSDTTPPTEVTVRNAMSYHGAFCRGPYVIEGDRREGFSPDQLARIAAARSQIFPRDAAHLPDVCAGSGGDSDHDGICDDDDNCPSVRNTCQVDSDLDGFGDACDCPGATSSSWDIDGDGIPDPCDPDIDGDGCYNDPDEDDHPDEAALFSHTVTYIGCGIGSETFYVSDVADTDGDGTINCRDPDDDGDGICDAPGPACTEVGDPCPEVPGTFCTFPGLGEPCPPEWVLCGIDCVIYFLKIFELINPDPTQELVLDRISLVNRTFFTAPLAGKTAAESVKAIADRVGAVGGAVAAAAAPSSAAIFDAADDRQRLRVELWERRDGRERLAAVVGEYDATQLRVGDLVRGGLVRLKPAFDRAGSPILEVETTYGLGIRSPEALDRDLDGVPDLLDNCLEAANPLQQDADRDGFGNACDADLGQDGRVGEEDVERIHRCAGADLTVEVPILEPAVFDGEVLADPEGPSPEMPDPVAAALAVACAAADLDGDGDVDAADGRHADAALGSVPGPSALARGFEPLKVSFAPICADGARVEDARLTLAGLARVGGSQQLRLAGELTLPPSPPVDPSSNGFLLTVKDATASILFDVALPGGSEWRTQRSGRTVRHTYHGGAAGVGNLAVIVSGGRVELRVVANQVDVGAGDPTLPLLAQVGFDADAVATRQCGETDFDAGGQPTCRLAGRGDHVECR